MSTGCALEVPKDNSQVKCRWLQHPRLLEKDTQLLKRRCLGGHFLSEEEGQNGGSQGRLFMFMWLCVSFTSSRISKLPPPPTSLLATTLAENLRQGQQTGCRNVGLIKIRDKRLWGL